MLKGINIMDNKARSMLSSYLRDIKMRCKSEQLMFRNLAGYESKRLRLTRTHNSKNYYSVFIPGQNSYKYLGSEGNSEVCKIKKAHFLERSIKDLTSEIHHVEQFLYKSKGVSYDDINARLPKVYRNASVPHVMSSSDTAIAWKEKMEKYKASFPPYRPEELIHRTHDNTLVRSKGEALIYNYLLELGVTFVYELPLRIKIGDKDGLLLPDFTILSERDYKTVLYLEHQGMMSVSKYRTKFNDTVYKYWLNNYLPERDVFFTFDSPNGGFDDTPVKSIVQMYIKREAS